MPSALETTGLDSSAKSWALPVRGSALFYGCPQIIRLSHYFLPRVVADGKRALYLDGANQFDPLLFSRMARERGRTPSDFNRSIRVARAFTCFQLTELLVRAPKLLKTFPADVVILTALPELYFDEDVREADALASFRKALGALQFLAGRLPVAVFSDPSSFSTPRWKFFERVKACAAQVWKVSGQEDGKLLIADDRAVSRALPAARI